MSVALEIPVGDEPDWETKQTDDEAPLNSIFESSVICHALRQSRNAWLTTIFPKFTSKSKAKGQKDVLQPPHNLRFIAKCDIEIGPHIFTDTSVYEAHYLSEPSHYAMGTPATYPQTTTYSQTASGTYTYPLTNYSPYVAPAEPRATSSVTAPSSTSEAIDPSLDVTPALIAQVNEAAATNPTLHHLLQIAAAGEASMDQLRTLGFFIQSLATAQQQTSSMTPTASFLGSQSTPPPSAFMQAAKYSPPHSIMKRSDLVLEFRENHTERFLVPREIVACEQEIPQSQTFRKDIVLYTFVPFLNDEVKFKAASASSSSRTPTIIRLMNVSEAIWEAIRSWVNEEAKHADAWDSFYDKAEASGPRAYLQYRLPSGDLLSQLRISCNNGYTMKSIKPASVSETTSNKRNRSRKSTSQAAKNANTPKNTNGTNMQAAPSEVSGEPALGKESAPKRRKPSAKAVSTPTTGGLYFIHTIVPPPAPLHLYPEVPTVQATVPASTELLPQPTESPRL